jgi:3-oxoacyl-(acyl-carrier-protein) synthase
VTTARRKIFITGAGIVSAAGIGMPAFWETLRSGRGGVGPITFERPARNNVQVGGAVEIL